MALRSWSLGSCCCSVSTGRPPWCWSTDLSTCCRSPRLSCWVGGHPWRSKRGWCPIRRFSSVGGQPAGRGRGIDDAGWARVCVDDAAGRFRGQACRPDRAWALRRGEGARSTWFLVPYAGDHCFDAGVGRAAPHSRESESTPHGASCGGRFGCHSLVDRHGRRRLGVLRLLPERYDSARGSTCGSWWDTRFSGFFRCTARHGRPKDGCVSLPLRWLVERLRQPSLRSPGTSSGAAGIGGGVRVGMAVALVLVVALTGRGYTGARMTLAAPMDRASERAAGAAQVAADAVTLVVLFRGGRASRRRGRRSRSVGGDSRGRPRWVCPRRWRCCSQRHTGSSVPSRSR